MTDQQLTVQAIDRSEIDIKTMAQESLWGGIDPPPSWLKYLEGFDDDFKPYIVVTRQWLIDTYGDNPPKAGQWCNDNVLLFSDGFCLSFTWRAWGDFVQAVRNEKEGYLTYYS